MALLNFKDARVNFAAMFATFAAATDSTESHLKSKGIELKYLYEIWSVCCYNVEKMASK